MQLIGNLKIVGARFNFFGSFKKNVSFKAPIRKLLLDNTN